MIEYKKHKTPDNIKEYFEILKKEWENNYEFVMEKFSYLIFSKKVCWKIDTIKKEVIKTKEWLEFYEIYKTIKNNWLSSDRLINKYNSLVDLWLHNLIINNLKKYKKYLEVKNKQEYALMASTYINQARYNDKWEIVEDMSKKWINDIFEERWLEKHIIDNVLTEIQNWEYKNKPKEITNWVVNNIIDYVLWKYEI